jgi:hypothetical protein
MNASLPFGSLSPSTQKKFGIAALALLIFVGIACSKSSAPSSASTGSADLAPLTGEGTAPSSVAPPLAQPKPRAKLPPEPGPSLPKLAAEVPDLEKKLAGIKAYGGIWEPARRDDRTLLLTSVSSLVAIGGLYGPVIPAMEAKKQLMDAATKLFLIFSRVGHFPDDFTIALKAHLEAVKGEPHLGLWSPWAKGQVPHDFTALASWLNREQPEVMRELIAARQSGPIEWTELDPKDPPLRPYLVEEKAALEWLALLSPLEADEKARLAKLRVEASIVHTSIGELLGEYKDNELRADGKFKGKTVQVTGVVDAVKTDVMGHIYVSVGTGKILEVPVLQCFFAGSEAGGVSALSRGEKVTVRGRVAGLTMNVLARDCELVP